MESVTWVNRKGVNQKRVEELLNESLETGQMTNYGPLVQRLEGVTRDLLKINENKAVIATNNGTSALHALVSGLNLYYGRKLRFATQAFTFPSSIQGPLSDSVIVDIDDDWQFDLDQVPSDIDGIIVTNIFGYLVEIERFTAWAEEHRKILLFDNAATSFSFYKGQNSCNYGDGAIISFHHTKPIGFGEGGCVIVDKKYEQHVRSAINFRTIDGGWSQEASNYKMADVAAAYIIQYLDDFEEIVAHHRKLLKHFGNRFPDHSGVTPFVAGLLVIMDKKVDNVGSVSRKYYKPLKELPKSVELYERILCFPCHKEMGIDHVEEILGYVESLQQR